MMTLRKDLRYEMSAKNLSCLHCLEAVQEDEQGDKLKLGRVGTD
jgi:hypothetical protein